MPKITAILSGRDWVDASVDHLVIPATLDIKVAKVDYDKWYRETYCPASVGHRRYLTFVEWLVERRGAWYPAEDELLIVEI